MKCLIVEDEAVAQMLLRECLSPYGKCHVTENGLLAVQTYRSSLEDKDPYDLLCLDVMMPHMDGHTIINEIRESEAEYGISDEEKAKIMMVSSIDDPDLIERAYSYGCDVYLIKPIDPGLLRMQMSKLGFTQDLNSTI